MPEEAKQNEPQEKPRFKPQESFLVDEARNILRDLSPTTWDRYAYDLLLIQKIRWNWDLENSDVQKAVDDAVVEEAQLNTSRYQQYAASGGRVTKKKDPFGGEAIEILPESRQTGGFVTGGRIVGDQIILETEFGTVNTTTDHILSFELFQRDVLRSCARVYPSRYKKNHEQSVVGWLQFLSRVEKVEEDDTLPLNILREYMEEFLQYAEVEPERFEGAIKNKFKPILRDGKEYQFSPDNLLSFLKVDKERKWKKSEIKIYLQHIYGEQFSTDKRAYNCRVFSIMQRKPEVPPDAAIVRRTPAAGGADQAEVQHDGGGGEDDTADKRRDGTPGEGGQPAGDSDPVVLEGDRHGSEGPSATTPDIPF